MLRSADEILSYKLQAGDGQLGKVKDIYFDDESWVIRYFVADTRRWLPGRKVLLFPHLVGEPDWFARLIPVELTREQIENAPSADEESPVSEEHEAALARYYLWQPGTAPPRGYPVIPPPPPAEARERDPEESHLRSLREVTGYRIRAADGEIGHVEDLVADTDGWILRYIVVDTRHWLPGGKKVLISPAWIESVDWSERQVKVELGQDQVRASPPFDPAAPVNREVETRLYDYYGRPRYWL